VELVLFCAKLSVYHSRVDASATTDRTETDLRREVELIASVMESMPSGQDAASYFREDSVRLEWAVAQAVERAFQKGTTDGRAQGEEQGRKDALDEAELMRKGRTSWPMLLVGIALTATLTHLFLVGYQR
jgi:hypothetical protein